MNTQKTYAGIPQEYGKLETAKIVLIPVPYDGTSTWQGIHLTEAVTEASSPEAMVEAVHAATKRYIKKNKFVTIFGGEHSISIGTIRAFNECFDNLTVLQLDAHADLRKEYEGSSCNHACAVYEASQTTNLIQVGIRSMDISETTVLDQEKTYFAHEMVNDDSWMESSIDQMTENVFITIDLDAFDPSILSSTGTPEPGGLLWYETLEYLKQVFQEKNVVGFDIVELCPNANDKSSDFLAAKLYYKMLSYKFQGDAINEDFDTDEQTISKKNNATKFNEEDDY